MAFCGNNHQRYVVARHIEDLIRHRRRIWDVLEAVKYRCAGVAALCQSAHLLTIAEAFPILEALAAATEDVLDAVHEWRKDLWVHLNSA